MSTNLARGPKGRPPRIAALPAGPGRARRGAQDAVFPASRGGADGRYGTGPGRPVSRQTALPVPPELPGLPPRPRVLQLTDGDCVSHGLAVGSSRQRASDQEVRSCLDRVHATAALLDPHARIRCAVSTETAARHLDVLTAAAQQPVCHPPRARRCRLGAARGADRLDRRPHDCHPAGPQAASSGSPTW